ncbi:MAG: endonuclease domain-containing protein [Lysobacteraceae bacterium]|nr:MAG: endonuclease domain-containing protein [Xanthomonadaceae bacterium]
MRGKQDHSRERALRQQQTDAELLIWQCLRGRRLHECRFRRQHRVGPFYLDFVCLEIGLIVELDGSQHLEPEQMHADGLRTLYLQKMGYRVLRFWNDEVLRDTDLVLDEISRVVQAAPHPAFGHPLPAGGARDAD